MNGNSHRIFGIGLAASFICLLCTPQVLAQRLRFGVIGDSGSGKDNQYRLARQMERWNVSHPWEFLLLLGDNVYPDGNPELFDEKCFTPYRGLLSRGTRIHAALGNHDVRHPAAQRGCAQARDPRFGYVGENDEYVLDAGGEVEGKRLVRLIVLNSTAWKAISRTGDCHYPDCRDSLVDRAARLKRWLSESDRFHWNILVLHHPMYSFVKPWYHPPFLNGHGSSTELRQILEPLIAGKVDLVLAGHDHFYQRIAPQRGIYHFVSGGGSNLRTGGDFHHALVQKGAKINHFMDLEVTSRELQFRVVDAQGRIFDEGVLTRTR